MRSRSAGSAHARSDAQRSSGSSTAKQETARASHVKAASSSSARTRTRTRSGGQRAVQTASEQRRNGRDTGRSTSRDLHDAKSADIIQKHMLPGGFASSPDGTAISLPQWVNPYLILGVIIALVLLFIWHPWAGSDGSAGVPGDQQPIAEEQVPLTLEEALDTFPAYDQMKPTDFSKVPSDSQSIVGFSLAGGDAPVISDESRQAIDQAMAALTEDGGKAGFLLMDIGSGRGFAENIDTEIYGASTFKGPFCLYICENEVDTGDYKLTTKVRDGVMSKSGSFSYKGKDTLKNMISDSIIWSDNGSFGALRAAFNDSSLDGWLESLGADGDIAYDAWFPHYTVRDAARMWSEMYNYMQTDSDGAALLSDLFAKTDTSFTRDALEAAVASAEGEEAAEEGDPNVDPETGHYSSTEQLIEVEESASGGDGSGDYLNITMVDSDGNEAIIEESDEGGDTASDDSEIAVETQSEDGSESLILVRGKAGWYPSQKKNSSSISENSIITYNGRDYLLCVMTGAYYNDRNVIKMQDLVTAVFNAHADLANEPERPDSEEGEGQSA